MPALIFNLVREILWPVQEARWYFRERKLSDGVRSRSPQLFEREILPHLDTAYNLARWLTLDASAANDIVQESFARAMKQFSDYDGRDAKVWLLGIVRDVCREWIDQQSTTRDLSEFDRSSPVEARPAEDATKVHEAIEALPRDYREILVMRELELISVDQIAEVERLPEALVRTMLTRAHARLEISLADLHGDAA